MEGPDDATSDAEEYEPCHITAHINTALGLSRDGSRWWFKKFFKAVDARDWEGPITNDEPGDITKQVVKLFICEAHDATTIDRVIVKTGSITVDQHDMNKIERSEQLSHLDEHNYIIKFRDWSRHDDFPMKLHAYIAWAPYSALSSLVQRFYQRNKPVPAFFIWLIIRNLVRACQVVESAGLIHQTSNSTTSSSTRRAETRTTRPSATPCSATSTPWSNTVTRSTHPSERADGSRTNNSLEAGAHHLRNCMCRLSASSRLGNVEQLPCSDETPFPGEGDAKTYSVRLREIIRWCMKPFLSERPTLEQLGAEADEVLRLLEESRCPGVKTMEEHQLPLEMHLDLGVERWEVGGMSTTKRRDGEE
ncbi:hypothetical protein CC86DRAFT_411849 [Ophiobolus disseminans]|uniref:Protein kinase domain-containing protein n=1 Tax=Ophiobolus disseminans TaxID=1469910 RepID=A0A6A6ZIL9_9PLEO|nr:hypothetical protein CC86DRAFT_411849 [Ophiobolus disseminans]